MNRDNLKAANAINEKLKPLEMQRSMLDDGGFMDVFIKYKSDGHRQVYLVDESRKIVHMLAISHLDKQIEELKAELELL